MGDFRPLILCVPPLKLPWPWQHCLPFGLISVWAMAGSQSAVVLPSLICFLTLQLWYPVTFGCSHTFNSILKAQDFLNQESSLEECASGSEGLSNRNFRHSKDSLCFEHCLAADLSPFRQVSALSYTFLCLLCKWGVAVSQAGCQG